MTEHIVASGNDWTREQALHAMDCEVCIPWRRQASEWLRRHPDEPGTPAMTTEYAVGYVVVEFNQASGQPELASDELFDDYDVAEGEADIMQTRTIGTGRRERYAVGTVTIEEEN